jgi:NitT/TauT family transport system substrate-binding protein
LAAGLCVTPAVAQANQEVALRLDWLASGYHGPFFLALERGYYREKGIDLKILDGKGSTSTIQLVTSGAETFGLANLSTTALAISKGLPLIAVSGVVQKSPDSVISLESEGIKSPKDMEGRRGGFVPTSASDRIFPVFAKSANVDIDKIIKLQIDSSARYSVLLQGNADFVIGWSITDAYKIGKQRPISPPILFSDYGVNTLSIGIITAKETIAKKKELVKSFLAASRKGMEDAIRSPEAAVDAIMKVRPGSDRDALLSAAKQLGSFVQTKNSAGKPLGWMATADWEQSKRLLVEDLGMNSATPVDSLFTNELQPN